jgi:hypothetical protein
MFTIMLTLAFAKLRLLYTLFHFASLFKSVSAGLLLVQYFTGKDPAKILYIVSSVEIGLCVLPMEEDSNISAFPAATTAPLTKGEFFKASSFYEYFRYISSEILEPSHLLGSTGCNL